MSERWKPENGENYWFINFSGAITKDAISLNGNHGMEFDSIMIENGNCFRTRAEAEAAAEKVRELLLSLHDNDENLQENIQDMVTNTCQAMDKGKENVAKATCTFGNLPKLTAEVFDRPVCPEWAKYGAVHSNGAGYYYSEKPFILSKEFGWSMMCSESNCSEIISGDFNNRNWHISLIKRPEKTTLPEWCKVGEWIYTSSEQYLKIEGISIDLQKIELSNGATWSKQDIIDEAVSARLRPYNAEEMKSLMGKVIKKGPSMHIVTGFENVFDNECMVHVNGCLYSANDLLRQFTIDNKPAGVLEHRENGEWVK